LTPWRRIKRFLARRETFDQTAPRGGIRAVSLTMVKDEQDIIEPFLRTNRPYLDAMIVMDNGSTDATRRITMDCARELGGIFVIDSPSAEFRQDAQISAALQSVQTALFADHVVLLDGDEFLCAMTPPAFRQGLSEAIFGTMTLHPLRDHLPDPAGPAGPDPLEAVRFTRREELDVVHKAILHLGGGCSADLRVAPGGHAAREGGRRLPEKLRADMPFVHVPIRSAAQLAGKAIAVWNSRVLQQPELALLGPDYRGRSHHRKRLFERVRRLGPDLGSDDVADLAMNYGRLESPCAFATNAIEGRPALDLTRRHSDGRALDPEKAVYASFFAPPAAPNLGRLTAGISDGARPVAAMPAARATADYFDAAPFRFIAERDQPHSVLDYGCGPGRHLLLFESLGASEILGIDGADASTTRLAPHQYRRHDMNRPLDLGRRFDLVLCLEVLQHLDPATDAVAFDAIAAHAADRIIFSVAAPGQHSRHANSLPMGRVLDLWASRGWVPELVDTLGLRALSDLSWLRRNLLVLRRSRPSESGEAATALRSIAEMEFRWYAQPPGLRSTAFCEPPPPAGRAYGKVRPRPV
jgi:SAM-dependent methyltransferase